MIKKLKNAYIEWWARRLPDCDATTRLISDSMDRKLPFVERLKVRLHIHICLWCARYARQLLVMRETLQKRANSEALTTTGPVMSAEARERLKRKLTQE